ncbi:sulfatase-like hydrolase/transferase [Ramlibacter sp. USB13]|uniref:Sulfatase-like hydrolase/transferase n=1 Tax=Ramlibacter cellulosilyticus TaxID=2764187 RepID=A0A923MW52_9BURK|nr:sulfatase-like hydrolase/transferase [Ramlibacter cellulosilyticus]MBC5785808.1 sulfatase-like hydrolase/transferase [Ramlibacter cellulosilyticus]
MKSWRWLLAAGALALASCGGGGGGIQLPGAPPRPNILFVILDDVGVDQMASFGYGGPVPPHVPNMDAVAAAGVRFRNAWSMPECSPGRAAFFVGRFPHRTNVYAAIGPNDLAQSQVSPYDMTVPKLLKQAGYENGMFGKFHLAGPENNPAGNGTPAVLGWDHFTGWIGGVPASIDTTGGGLAPAKTYTCGFVPPAGQRGGADTGACYRPDGSCSVKTRAAPSQDAAGLQCVNAGGLFVPDQACGTRPASLDFRRENAYYVSPLVVVDGGRVEQVPLDDSRGRGYRTRIEADAAIAWIKSRASGKPWMATVSFSAAHTPLQQPPMALVPHSGHADKDALDCDGVLAGRVLQNQMTEALDTEFGRILVETGIAKRAGDGSLQYDPKASNTVIVIVGDNGSLGFSVKPPFNSQLAKGTTYQTGIWDPLIVAGPPVAQPGRAVEHMVNMVDVFQLFGELAGIDVHKAVPRTVDSVALLPYLTNAGQGSLRTMNFAMTGFNLQANGGRNGPCVIQTSCTQIPMTKSVCEDNAGVWWGSGYTDPSVVPNGGAGYPGCCQVNQALSRAGRTTVSVLPEFSSALRNERYKVIRNTTQTYDPAADSCNPVTTNEFYAIDQASPTPLLDDPDRNLLLAPLTPELQRVYGELTARLDEVLASEPACPGDGNKDGVVDAQDLANVQALATGWGFSSVYDFAGTDGVTAAADVDLVRQNLGRGCAKSHGVY